jgi:hypothetical protein
MSMISITIRRGRRDDVGAIVAMLADDPLGSGRERPEDPLPSSYLPRVRTGGARSQFSTRGHGGWRRRGIRVDAQRFYVRLGFQPSHVGMTLRF